MTLSYSQSLSAVVDRIRAARQLAIFTHVRPDPDALGSQAAAALIAQRLGAKPSIVELSETAALYKFLHADLPGIPHLPFTAWQSAADSFDTILVVDTCAFHQLQPADVFLKTCFDRIVVIDHHLTRDPVGKLICSDTTAAACVEILADLAQTAGIALDQSLGLPLLAGLVADTGWFRFDNVTPRTHRLAANIMQAGVNQAALYERLMQNDTPPRLALMQRALAGLQWFSNHRFACMSLSQQDFSATGAAPAQTEALVDLPLQVGSTEVSALLTQMPDGIVRASLRAKHAVDVSAICKQFGGGGHAKAAACRLPGPLDHAIKTIAAAVANALE